MADSKAVGKTEPSVTSAILAQSEAEAAAALAVRLREAIDHAGGVTAVVRASRGRLSARTIHRYLSADSEPGIFAIKLIAEITNWDLDYLAYGETEPISSQAAKNGRRRVAAAAATGRSVGSADEPGFTHGAASAEIVHLPKLAFRAGAAGSDEHGTLVADGDPDTIAFPRLILDRVAVKPENGRLLDGSGESMTPTIQDGELLLMDVSQRELRDNKVFVFVVGEQCYVKRLRRVGGKVMMISDNKEFPPEPVPKDEYFDIFGMVRWAGRSL